MDLFEQRSIETTSKNAPLADRMRPRTLDEFIGQTHIIGHGRLLRRAIQIDRLSSVIFYGPPGTGKTTLARIIANTTKAEFLSINAVLAGVKEIRTSIETAQRMLSLYEKRTILFVDEVHRFNKSQQDALLPHVENGTIILIGATTENPYFEVNKALVSRSRIFQLKSLTHDDLINVAKQALTNKERGYGTKNINISNDALEHLVNVANGDARGVLNALELAVETTKPDPNDTINITMNVVEESIQQRAVLYDKDGDAHYDTISAFIKSIRGSDPDAALYWMAKMVYAGEDPRFIFRRLMILACEDIGMADPKALGVVTDSANAFDYVGLPEGQYHLAHACLYCATAPKSNSSMAYFDALNTVKNESNKDIPDHLKDANRDGDDFGHGKNYAYPHAYRDHWVAQQYLPKSMQSRVFYQPSNQGFEKQIQSDVFRRKEAQLEAMIEPEVDWMQNNNSDIQDSQWQKRTSGTFGQVLSQIRDLVIEQAKLQPEDLVLDLNGRTGLITFELIRHVNRGDVWVIAHDEKSSDTLHKISTKLDTFSQPQIIQATINDFDKKIKLIAGDSIKFNKIVGRNIIFKEKNKYDIIKRILLLLDQKGKLILAETVVSESQRLSDIINLPKKLKQKFHDAENSFFTNSNNPMMNWTCESLCKELNKIPNVKVTFTKNIFTPIRRFSPQDIDYWFRKSNDKTNFSLGDSIKKHLEEKEIEKIKQALHFKLDNQDTNWKTTTGFFIIENEF